MAKFKNRYRIESTRMQNWDYGWNEIPEHFPHITPGQKLCQNQGKNTISFIIG